MPDIDDSNDGYDGNDGILDSEEGMCFTFSRVQLFYFGVGYFHHRDCSSEITVK